MNLTPDHLRRPGDGPMNAKPVALWTPRTLGPGHEAALTNAGFTLVRTPYETPLVTRRKTKGSYEDINAACLEVWRGITKQARAKLPEVVVWTSVMGMFRPMIDVIIRETGGFTIIVKPDEDAAFTRIVLHETHMHFMPWTPNVREVLARRRYLHQRRAS